MDLLRLLNAVRGHIRLLEVPRDINSAVRSRILVKTIIVKGLHKLFEVTGEVGVKKGEFMLDTGQEG